MESRTRNLLASRKGQFFILSAVAIVTILFFISKSIEPLTLSDTSSIVLSDETSTFDNIRDKAVNAVKGSENCNELNFNLQEYQNFVAKYALERGYQLNFDYTIPSCTSSATVTIHIKLHSNTGDEESTFVVNWP